MPARQLDLELDQGGTFLTSMTFVKDGVALDLTDIKFVGTVKDSIYDTEGYPIRFDLVDANNVNMYIDADVTELMEFTKGVYEVKMIQVDGFNTPLLKGNVTLSLGATDETHYS